MRDLIYFDVIMTHVSWRPYGWLDATDLRAVVCKKRQKENDGADTISRFDRPRKSVTLLTIRFFLLSFAIPRAATSCSSMRRWLSIRRKRRIYRISDVLEWIKAAWHRLVQLLLTRRKIDAYVNRMRFYSWSQQRKVRFSTRDMYNLL